MMTSVKAPALPFSKYQIFVIAILAFLQFTIVLDFMILSPLGAILLPALKITTAQFGMVVSAYAFSAGISGFLSAGFADRFDRKRMLLFFYTGFLIGTLLCGLAPNYYALLFARIFTGTFGGVMGSIVFAIIADLFSFQQRGRVMGFVQTAFAGSQVLGIPLGLFLSNHLGWHAPFFMIVTIGLIAGLIIAFYLKPVNAHLHTNAKRNPFIHLWKTISTPRYLWGFSSTILLATGGFMLMPFGSPFAVNNLGISLHQLPIVYMVTGVTSIIVGPYIGKLSDKIGAIKVFSMGSILAIAVVLYYCQMGKSSLLLVIIVNIVLFVAISSRMISSMALSSAIPSLHDRGAYSSINASMQQMAGGVASMIAGMIVVQTSTGALEHYDRLSYVVAIAMVITLGLMIKVSKMVHS